MKPLKLRSLYALAIAFVTHAVVIALMLLMVWYLPEFFSSPQPHGKQLIRLSLKENPAVTKEALVKNDLPKTTNSLPIPRGEQLVKPAAPSQEPEVSKPETPLAEPKTIVPDAVERPIVEEAEETYERRLVQELYGDVFNELSEGEQKFILDNQETMRRITQNVLGRYAPYRIPPGLDANESNMVEFYLYPDGSVSHLRFLAVSRLELLNDVTLETLGIAYKKYPRPEQPTLIRYRIQYSLGGH